MTDRIHEAAGLELDAAIQLMQNETRVDVIDRRDGVVVLTGRLVMIEPKGGAATVRGCFDEGAFPPQPVEVYYKGQGEDEVRIALRCIVPGPALERRATSIAELGGLALDDRRYATLARWAAKRTGGSGRSLLDALNELREAAKGPEGEQGVVRDLNALL